MTKKPAKKTLQKTLTQALRGEKNEYTPTNFNMYAKIYKKEAGEVIGREWEAHKAKRLANDSELRAMSLDEQKGVFNKEKVSIRNITLQKHYDTLPQSVKDQCEKERLTWQKSKATNEADNEEGKNKRDLRNRIE